MKKWLNSSIGLLTLLATRNTTRGAWVQMKKADLVGMPVLDLRAIPPERLQSLSQLFDDIAEHEFERLPAMAECGRSPPPGRRVDGNFWVYRISMGCAGCWHRSRW